MASPLIFEIIGVDRASKVFDKVSHSTEKAEGRLTKLKAAGGLAMVALAAGAVEFGKKSVDKFQEVGGETIRLKRILGGTSEEVSRLRFAGEETGVGIDKLTVGFGILSKHLSANDGAWKSLGVNAKDAHGKIRPMAELIPDIAEKFAKMPAGPQKTAAAMKLFGKSGKDLLPFLNKGKDGLKDLGKESDKFGDTLNSKDTAAVGKNIIAKRQLGAAVSGLEIQLGQKLMPAVTSVVTAVTGLVVWFSNLSGTAKTVIGVAAALVGIIIAIVQITKVWTAVQAAFNVIMDMNPIMLIVIGLALLVAGLIIAYKKFDTFRAIVNGVLGFVRDHWKLLLGILTGPVGLAIVWITTNWNTVKGIFGGVKKAIGKAFSGLVGVIEAPFKTAFGWITSAIQGMLNAFNAAKNFITGGSASAAAKVAKTHSFPVGRGGGVGPPRAKGGPVRAGFQYTVGENGIEQFVAPADGYIVPNGGGGGSRGSGGSGGGGGTVVNITIGQSASAEARRIVELLAQYSRVTGPLQIKVAG